MESNRRFDSGPSHLPSFSATYGAAGPLDYAFQKESQKVFSNVTTVFRRVFALAQDGEPLMVSDLTGALSTPPSSSKPAPLAMPPNLLRPHELLSLITRKLQSSTGSEGCFQKESHC